MIAQSLIRCSEPLNGFRHSFSGYQTRCLDALSGSERLIQQPYHTFKNNGINIKIGCRFNNSMYMQFGRLGFFFFCIQMWYIDNEVLTATFMGTHTRRSNWMMNIEQPNGQRCSFFMQVSPISKTGSCSGWLLTSLVEHGSFSKCSVNFNPVLYPFLCTE